MNNDANALDADRLLSLELPVPYQSKCIDRTMVSRVQHVLDAAMHNHEVVALRNTTTQKAVLFQSPQGTMKDSLMAARGVRYVPLAASDMNRLPLAAAWTRGTRDPIRDEMLAILKASLKRYAKEA